MKKQTIAFLYNVRHHYPDPLDLRIQRETDYDDPQTIEAMIRHFEACGFEVIPIEADEQAYAKLMAEKERIDLAFNFAEGLCGQDRECHFPAILEMLEIPYTGSGPLTQALVLDKAKTKDLLRAHGVPVLAQWVFEDADQLKGDWNFPLIVKPLSQGSSAGITNKSVVRSSQELRAQVEALLDAFGAAVMVEPFVEGREFSVALLGNPPQVLPIIEPDHQMLPAGYEKIDSLEVKWFFEESSENSQYLKCPAPLEEAQRQRMEQICLATWKALNIKDLCRIDLRCDAAGNPYVLEVNSPAGLLPPEISATSYFPLAARKAGISYDELLKTIIKTACARRKIDLT